jgi:hypothetical protein
MFIAPAKRLARSPAWRAAHALVAAMALAAGPVQGAVGQCDAAGTTSIAAVTGMAGEAIAEGESVVVEATVTASFLGRTRLDGFYLQGGNPPAGVFVYAPDFEPSAPPQRGERWRLRARTGRYRGRVQLEAIQGTRFCGNAPVAPVELDATRQDRLPALADRLVRLEGPLTVADVYDLGRYGSLGLAVGGRSFHPANGVNGGTRLAVLLDDGSYRRRPRPLPFVDNAGVRRAGDRVGNITGILTRAFGRWRIHPLDPPRFERRNPRPEPPAPGDGLRVAQWNLRNYFVDFDGRGARTPDALDRQRQRVRSVIRQLNADALVLHEVQNNARAVEDLLATVNRGLDEQARYRAVFRAGGEAVIRSVIFYRPNRLHALERRRAAAPIHPRPPLWVRFRRHGGDEFALLAAHFKSRGGCPEHGDQDHGQGCWAQRRHAQSRALLRWLDGLDRQRESMPPTLVLADFNAYVRENAMRTWRDAGFVDLIAAHVPPQGRYTYNYRGQSGYIDHALAGGGLSERIQRVNIWHINADEPAYPHRRGAGIWRASDHDPVIVELTGPAE